MKKTKKQVFTKRLTPITDLVKMREVIQGIHGLMDARQATGYSNAKMGREMAEVTNRAEFFAPSTIARMCHPRAKWHMRMKHDHLDAAARVLDEWLKRELNRGDVRFQMTVNSPWKCWIEIQRACGHWEKFDLRREQARTCKECGASQ